MGSAKVGYWFQSDQQTKRWLRMGSCCSAGAGWQPAWGGGVRPLRSWVVTQLSSFGQAPVCQLSQMTNFRWVLFIQTSSPIHQTPKEGRNKLFGIGRGDLVNTAQILSSAEDACSLPVSWYNSVLCQEGLSQKGCRTQVSLF